MTPGPFVRVHDRVYWADQWYPWSPEFVHVRWAPIDAPDDWHTLTETPQAVRAMAGDGEAAFWIEGDDGTPTGGLWRVDAEGEPALLEGDLTAPTGLRHRPGPEGGWLYYSSRASDMPDSTTLLHRARPDGSAAQVIAERSGFIVAIDLGPTDLWWTESSGDIWRMPLDGGPPELAFTDTTFPTDIEVVGSKTFIVSFGSLYRLTPGAEPEYIEGLGDNGGIEATDTHVYFSAQNVFEDTHLGWIHRIPIDAEPFGGEFVTSKFAPAPTEMIDDADALYWATADEDTGQGGIWMLCKDHE
ncbi:hypothetical protein PPSIR1_22461 [Plesiocystis pacifica SIR-1]|uniref:Uncharacterized protein n=2 Tax=Plesiocystis pacifica TaxID=191768 RepID=A6GGG4_9BACT|nr:hypothetical protein PPSIR1_22461 [Plesiocystis pacifica SIR-1]